MTERENRLVQENGKGKGIDDVLPSEVLYMFLGWLTCREQSITFGAYYEATQAIDLIEEFCNDNGFNSPREDWLEKLKCKSPK